MNNSKCVPFKEQKTLEERKETALGMMRQYSDSFPVVIEVDPRQFKNKDAKDISHYPPLK